jgi:LysM repeat protein
VLALAIVTAVAAAAATGAGAVWLLAVVLGAMTAGYLVLVARVRRIAAEREMTAAFAVDRAFDWDDFGRSLSDAAVSPEAAPDAVTPSVARVAVGHRDLLRFVGAWALGAALTPVVGAIRLAKGDLSDLERHGVIDALVRAQTYGRSQSLRVVAAGLVATAGVTTVGAVASTGTAYAGPSVVASAAATATGTQYTVRSGDTLSGIARRFDVTVAAVAAANRISDVNRILTGRVLVIPGPGSASGGTSTYTVEAGDTLSALALRFGTTVDSLVSLNHIADANLIVVGQRLAVDGHDSASAGSTGAAPSLTATGSYTVRSGDTLSSIAARYGTTTADLVALNDLSDPDLVTVGEVLKVNGTAPSTPAPTTPAPTTTAPTGPTVTTPTPTTPTVTTPTTAGESAAAAEAVKVALEQVGTPYVYGGAAPGGFDCSGLVMYAWAAAGVSLPHYSVSQYEDTTRITEAQLLPGDLVFYDNYDGPQPGHVAMYIGGGQVVAANETGTDVQTQSITWDGTIIGFGRVG